MRLDTEKLRLLEVESARLSNKWSGVCDLVRSFVQIRSKLAEAIKDPEVAALVRKLDTVTTAEIRSGEIEARVIRDTPPDRRKRSTLARMEQLLPPQRSHHLDCSKDKRPDRSAHTRLDKFGSG